MIDPLLALPGLLAEATRPGDYYATGEISAPLPLIEVEGVGPLAFPVLDHQARHLLAVAEPAPYGRGEQTIVDPAVRRAGQIAPERLTIDAAAWLPMLDTITQQIKGGLGVPGEVEAQLYKLLVYGPGDFFTEHRDTEKAPARRRGRPALSGRRGPLGGAPCTHRSGRAESRAQRSMPLRQRAEVQAVLHRAVDMRPTASNAATTELCSACRPYATDGTATVLDASRASATSGIVRIRLEG